MSKLLPAVSAAALLMLLATPALPQDCTAYFPMEEGKTFEITNYNPKGKVQSIGLHQITSRVANGSDIVVAVSSELKMKGKEDEPIQFDYQVECIDGEFRINTFRGISSDQLGAMGGSVEIDGDYLDLPSNLTAGQTLKDATIYLRFGTSEDSDQALMNFKYNITNRKVAAIEDVETPAGVFNSYKITYDVQTKMIVNIHSSVAEWYAEGVGVVKSEIYNKKGKLQGYSLLTKFE